MSKYCEICGNKIKRKNLVKIDKEYYHYSCMEYSDRLSVIGT